MQEAQEWLQSHYADGCNVSIKELIQYRGKTGLMNLSPSKTIQSKLAGSYVTKTKGRGMEFDEARHYQPGDDIRAIDWRVTARTGKTHTKLYREEKERPVFILADFSPSMYFGTQLMFKSVQAAHLASLIAWSAAARGDRVGGLVFNELAHKEFKPLTRQKAVLSLLSGMTNLHRQGLQQSLEDGTSDYGQDNFSDACARLRRLARPGSLVFMLSDFLHLSEKASQHISRIAKHCEIIAYQITDPFEHQLPQVSVPQNVSLTDGTRSQTITLGEAKTAQEYEASHQQMSEFIATSLKKCQAKHIPLSAASPIETQLTAGLRS
ncbi:DUF58 domain-containing protein [Alteromonas sp. a30]|uniref:DUF58 domain-containing protein n=1 Tax=Alteromonas sp. a30 TaxID=2730917 RepID=UPI0022819913|nr:DUF58 domain-containing protein [Alteromonas sp. a30]MCY7295868.1 DUF58 domain-containing protein [Alteromonas sp. a30]